MKTNERLPLAFGLLFSVAGFFLGYRVGVFKETLPLSAYFLFLVAYGIVWRWAPSWAFCQAPHRITRHVRAVVRLFLLWLVVGAQWVWLSLQYLEVAAAARGGVVDEAAKQWVLGLGLLFFLSWAAAFRYRHKEACRQMVEQIEV